MNGAPLPPALIAADWWALGPAIALSVGAMVMLMLEFLPTRSWTTRGAIVSLLSLGAAAASVWQVRDVKRTLFEGMFVHDPFTVFFTLLFCAIAAIAGATALPSRARSDVAHIPLPRPEPVRYLGSAAANPAEPEQAAPADPGAQRFAGRVGENLTESLKSAGVPEQQGREYVWVLAKAIDLAGGLSVDASSRRSIRATRAEHRRLFCLRFVSTLSPLPRCCGCGCAPRVWPLMAEPAAGRGQLLR